MVKVQQILVATDFSDNSSSAVDLAKNLASALNARLDVVHVVEEPFGYVASTHGYIPEVDAFLQSLNDAARAQLHRVLTPEEIERWHSRLSLRVGTPYVEIVRIAKDHGADLIVLGTHGRGPLLHLLLGSVAEKVVRLAHCPVLTVPQSAAEVKETTP